MFGVSVNTATKDIPFHTKFCKDCEVGINKMLMATRSVGAKPDFLWMVKIPFRMEVKGQVIGVGDKLVMFVSDGSTGYVIAFE